MIAVHLIAQSSSFGASGAAIKKMLLSYCLQKKEQNMHNRDSFTAQGDRASPAPPSTLTATLPSRPCFALLCFACANEQISALALGRRGKKETDAFERGIFFSSPSSPPPTPSLRRPTDVHPFLSLFPLPYLLSLRGRRRRRRRRGDSFPPLHSSAVPARCPAWLSSSSSLSSQFLKATGQPKHIHSKLFSQPPPLSLRRSD